MEDLLFVKVKVRFFFIEMNVYMKVFLVWESGFGKGLVCLVVLFIFSGCGLMSGFVFGSGSVLV